MSEELDRTTDVVISGGQNLWPFLIYGLSVVGLLAITLGLAWLLGARTRHTDSTDLPFESGVVHSVLTYASTWKYSGLTESSPNLRHRRSVGLA